MISLFLPVFFARDCGFLGTSTYAGKAEKLLNNSGFAHRNKENQMASARRILFIAVLFFLVRPLHAQSVRLNLKGDELLIAYQGREARKSEIPGIYALDKEGDLKLIVPYGREPRWSPDREKIAFLLDEGRGITVLNRIDVSKGERRRVVSAERWLDIPFLPNEFSIRPNGISWTPSSLEVVAWSVDRVSPVAPNENQEMHISGALICPFLIPYREQPDGILHSMLLDPELTNKRNGVIGRVSFKSSTSLAYEWLGRQAWANSQQNPEVWIMDRETATDKMLIPPLPDSVGMMNPLWSPDGKWLAVDVVSESGDWRDCVIMLSNGEGVRLLRSTVSPENRYRKYPWAGMAWSPQSDKLIVSCLYASHYQLSNLMVLDVNSINNENPLVVGSFGYISQACWSPDGKSFAFIDGSARGSEKFSSTLSVVSVKNVDDGSVRIVPPFKCLNPVSITW